MRGFLAAWLWWAALLFSARGQPALPPAPANFVTDRAGVLSAETVQQLNHQLAELEGSDSTQIVVWIEPALPAGAALEDYTHRLFEAWKIGQRNRNNGVLLAIFPTDRRMRIETGYGLEGALPDVLAGRIINDEIAPRFRAQDYSGGVTAGVNAIVAVVRGEYRGTGQTQLAAQRQREAWWWAVPAALLGAVVGAWARGGVFKTSSRMIKISQQVLGGLIGGIGHGLSAVVWRTAGLVPALFALFFVWCFLLAGNRGTAYSRRGRRTYGGWDSWGGSWGSGGGSSSWSGGFGGGFSGGGGRSGGGGASGGW
ncbi:MAG TPA: TPM domain-containing protein [Verrucomicrobiota bacterium]|nr:TPM domain-containing protein [Verrucomicrobiota bacterium]